jgi:uncharacterized RDD family membrane protein YckC
VATDRDWQDAQRSLVEQSPLAAEVAYASWGARLVALILDNLLVGVVVFAAGAALGTAGGDTEGGIGVGLLIYWVAGWLYFALLEGRPSGQTLAKRALKIAVRDAEGGPPGYGKAFGRELLRLAFGIIPLLPLLDGLWPLWDGRNQTLHDKAAGRIVVRA